eukprot:1675874-Pleurochrysis_carterae.AAC.1
MNEASSSCSNRPRLSVYILKGLCWLQEWAIRNYRNTNVCRISIASAPALNHCFNLSRPSFLRVVNVAPGVVSGDEHIRSSQANMIQPIRQKCSYNRAERRR